MEYPEGFPGKEEFKVPPAGSGSPKGGTVALLDLPLDGGAHLYSLTQSAEETHFKLFYTASFMFELRRPIKLRALHFVSKSSCS